MFTKDKHSSFLGTCGIAAKKSFITLVPDQHRAISCWQTSPQGQESCWGN